MADYEITGPPQARRGSATSDQDENPATMSFIVSEGEAEPREPHTARPGHDDAGSVPQEEPLELFASGRFCQHGTALAAGGSPKAREHVAQGAEAVADGRAVHSQEQCHVSAAEEVGFSGFRKATSFFFDSASEDKMTTSGGCAERCASNESPISPKSAVSSQKSQRSRISRMSVSSGLSEFLKKSVGSSSGYKEELMMALRKSQQIEDKHGWSSTRRFCSYILEAPLPFTNNSALDIFMCLVILFNLVTMVAESDARAECDAADCVQDWVVLCNAVMLSLYTVEVCLRLFVGRFKFFRSSWNLLDVGIVVVGLGSVALSDVVGGETSKVNIFRLARVIRIFRVAKFLKHVPTLRSMVWGFAGAMYAMSWGLLLIMFLIVFWSMLAVEFVHPVNKMLVHEDPYCTQAFSSTWRSTMLFFQTLVAGDSWGLCILPVINERPQTFVLFAFALVTIQLGFTNLVLAVIVDKATEAREGSKEEQRIEKVRKEISSLENWRNVMCALDTDDSKTISMEELMCGFNDPLVQSTMQQLNVKLNDVAALFTLMDADESGSLSYDELCDNFFTAQTQDPRIYNMSVKLQVQKLQHKMEKLMMDVTEKLEAASARDRWQASARDHWQGPLPARALHETAVHASAPPDTERRPWEAELVPTAQWAGEAADELMRAQEAVSSSVEQALQLELESNDMRNEFRSLQEQLKAVAQETATAEIAQGAAREAVHKPAVQCPTAAGAAAVAAPWPRGEEELAEHADEVAPIRGISFAAPSPPSCWSRSWKASVTGQILRTTPTLEPSVYR